MKILVFTKNWLGDILFQLPAIEMIHKNYPQAEIVCLAPARCHQILEAQPFVHRVLLFDEKKDHRSFFARLAFLKELKREKWDQGYLLHRSRTRAMLLKLAGAKKVIGYGMKRKLWLTDAVTEPVDPMHQVDYFIYLLKGAGLQASSEPYYRYPVASEDEQSADQLLKSQTPFVCFHLGANWEPKRWPPEHFAALADLMHQSHRTSIVLTGAERDLPLMREFMRKVRKAKVLSLVGKTSLGELAAIFKKSLFVVSGDSGPMHIASGVGANVVSLFGPTDPNLTGPRGVGQTLLLSYVPPGYHVPWYGKEFPKEGWLSQMSPDEVYDAILKKDWLQEKKESLSSKFKVQNLEFHSQHPSIKNILVITLSNIGDVILTTPVMTSLAWKYPKAKITAVVGPKAEDLLKGSSYVHRVVVYDKKAGWKQKFQFIQDLRKEFYDIVIDLRNSAIPFMIKRGRRSPILRLKQKTSMRERHLDVLRRTGIVPNHTYGFDFFNGEDQRLILERLQELSVPTSSGWIILAPVAQSPLKTWPMEKFQALTEKLLKDHSETILLVGHWEQRSEMDVLTRLDPKRIFNLAGKTNLRELAVILSRASLIVANDSAAMHLAFEYQRRVVAIFGPTHHEKYGHEGERFKLVRAGSKCSPCEKAVCAFERQHCFEDLEVESVFQACSDLLKESVEVFS